MTRTLQTHSAPAPRIHECGGLQSLRFDSEAGGRWSCESHFGPTLVIATRGRVEITGAGLGRCSVRRGRMALVPDGAEFRLRAYGKTRVLVCRFHPDGTALQSHFHRGDKWQAVPFCDGIRTVADLTEIMLRTDLTVSQPQSLDRKRLWLQELLRRQCRPARQTPSPSFTDLDLFLEEKRKASIMFQAALNSDPVRLMAREMARRIT